MRRILFNKKAFIIILLLCTFTILPVLAQGSQGFGFSYFLPKEGEGGLGLGFGLELGFGKTFSIIPKLSYFEFYGLETTDEYCNSGWFKTKSLLLDVLAKKEIQIGPVFPYILFGGAAIYNIQLVSLKGNIDRDFLDNSSLGGSIRTLTTNFRYDNKLGFGYSVGAGLKVKLKKFGFDVGFRYYWMRASLDLRGNYIEANESTPAVEKSYDNNDSKLIIDGILISISLII